MNKLWSGRFQQDTDATINAFNASIAFDHRLWRVDIQNSIAHVKMLGRCGIIASEEQLALIDGLIAVENDLDTGTSSFTEDAEDVHMNVELLLKAKIGPVAGKVHTARSRNDQVATDLRLWLKQELSAVKCAIGDVQSSLVDLSEQNLDILIPGMTHLQHAQPVRLAHHLLAYFWMLQRDQERLTDAYGRTNVLPLGSGALAGTTFPIDRAFVAQELGFGSVSVNSMDAVSDRDFVLESLGAFAIIMMHLSRFSEELILWNSREFGFVEMGDNVTTGSSIMPQKKNPDVAELIRGKTGRVYGDLLSVLTVMKGLPLTYNKDMQEDKEALFDAVDTVLGSLAALRILLGNLTFKAERLKQSMRGDFSTATDLADYLASTGIPFREAHEIVGRIVGDCLARGIVLEDLTPMDLEHYTSEFANAPSDLASVERSVERRESFGGTGWAAVLHQLKVARDCLGKT